MAETIAARTTRIRALPTKGLSKPARLLEQIARVEAGAGKARGKTRRRLWRLYERALLVAIGAAERAGVRGAVRCPICGWTGFRFRPRLAGGRVRRGVTCPGCDSRERHRLLAFVLESEPTTDGVGLHFAPEPWLSPLVGARRRRVITADYAQPGVDMRCDMEQMPLEDASVSLVICSDVLEHVRNDSRGLEELRRVLAPAGRALVHLPMIAVETVEFGRPVPFAHDHYRVYGPDVMERFARAGFEVDPLVTSSVPRRIRRTNGFHPKDVLFQLRTAGSSAGASETEPPAKTGSTTPGRSTRSHVAARPIKSTRTP